MDTSSGSGPTKVASPVDPDAALQFAIMLQAGLPAEQAIVYFVDLPDPVEVRHEVARWLKSRSVQAAQRTLLGKSWQEMTLDERISAGLNQQYNSQAYLCFSTSYVTADPQTKAKLDTARQALEAKLAGTAGKMDPLARFFDDLQQGRIKLGSVPAPPPARLQ